jgi:hypothetical protein
VSEAKPHPYPIGSLLLPNEYMVKNGKISSGLILGVVDDVWGYNYKVFLSPYNISKWLKEDVIKGLFLVVEP